MFKDINTFDTFLFITLLYKIEREQFRKIHAYYISWMKMNTKKVLLNLVV